MFLTPQLLNKIENFIREKEKFSYLGLFLLGKNSGLRVSEATSFNLFGARKKIYKEKLNTVSNFVIIIYYIVSIMKKQNQKKYVILGISLLTVVAGGIIFYNFHQPTEKVGKVNSQNRHHKPPYPNNNLSSQQTLVNKIKTDLKNDLEQAKSSDKEISTDHHKTLGECGDCGGWRYWYNGSDPLFDNLKKEKEGYLFPNEFESADWAEIDNLLNEIAKLNQEKREKQAQIHQAEQAKIKKKVAAMLSDGNKKTFFFHNIVEGEYLDRHSFAGNCNLFLGKENGQEFYLLIPDKHPAMANITDRARARTFWIIDGAENIPLEDNSCWGMKWKTKWVDINTNISLTPHNLLDF